jgi:Holliday junction DNA helicase RuvA
MIAHLRGILLFKSIESVVLEAGGVGYEVLVPLRVVEALPAAGSTVALWIHTQVREDAITLFGFDSQADRTLFQRLQTVTGVGPKLALQALSIHPASEIQRMIVQGDERGLTRIPGIGKKTAQRMLLELAEKLALLPTGEPATGAGRSVSPTGQATNELVLALLDLGYPRRQADDLALRLKPKAEAGTPVEALVMEALRLLRG